MLKSIKIELNKPFKQLSKQKAQEIVDKLVKIKSNSLFEDRFGRKQLQLIRNFLYHYIEFEQYTHKTPTQASNSLQQQLFELVKSIDNAIAKKKGTKGYSDYRRTVDASKIESSSFIHNLGTAKPDDEKSSLFDRLISNAVTGFMLQKPYTFWDNKQQLFRQNKQKWLRKNSRQAENIFLIDKRGSRLDAIHYRQPINCGEKSGEAIIVPPEQHYIIPVIGVGNCMEAILEETKAIADTTESNFLAFNFNGRCDSKGKIKNLGTAVDNTRAAIDYLISIGVKPEHICIVGHSNGAAIARKVAANYGTNFLSLSGYKDLASVINTKAEQIAKIISARLPLITDWIKSIAERVAARINKALKNTSNHYNLSDEEKNNDTNGFFIYNASKTEKRKSETKSVKEGQAAFDSDNQHNQVQTAEKLSEQQAKATYIHYRNNEDLVIGHDNLVGKEVAQQAKASKTSSTDAILIAQFFNSQATTELYKFKKGNVLKVYFDPDKLYDSHQQVSEEQLRTNPHNYKDRQIISNLVKLIFAQRKINEEAKIFSSIQQTSAKPQSEKESQSVTLQSVISAQVTEDSLSEGFKPKMI